MQWEGERGGPGAAELVKEWLNMHLPSPEALIKEERGQVPDAHVNVHTHRRASLFIKTGFSVRFEQSPPSKRSRQPNAALFLVVSYFSGMIGHVEMKEKCPGETGSAVLPSCRGRLEWADQRMPRFQSGGLCTRFLCTRMLTA